MPKRPAVRASRRPFCKRCNRRIPVPAGWSTGAATRRHYWSKHPEVMRAARNDG